MAQRLLSSRPLPVGHRPSFPVLRRRLLSCESRRRRLNRRLVLTRDSTRCCSRHATVSNVLPLGTRAVLKVRRLTICAAAEDKTTPIEVVQKENVQLKGEAEEGETAKGEEEAEEETETVVEAETPEDFWSPPVKGMTPSITHPCMVSLRDMDFGAGVETGYKDVYGKISPVPEHDGTEVMRLDQMLWDHQDHFKFRWDVFRNIRQAVDANEKGMEVFSQGHTLQQCLSHSFE